MYSSVVVFQAVGICEGCLQTVCACVCVCVCVCAAWTPVTMFDRCTHAFAIIYTLQIHRFGHPLNLERERDNSRRTRGEKFKYSGN